MIPPLLLEAVKIAKEKYHELKRYQFGCIAKRADGTLVSSTNHYQNHQQFSHHAEARVLRKCDAGATLYIARVSKKDLKTWKIAKPCSRCRNLIRHHKIKEVYYTIAPNEYGYWEVSKDVEAIKINKGGK